jgi:ferredoxin
MEITSVRLIYFSPTHTTKKVLTAIAKGIGCATVHHTDLTTPKKRASAERTLQDDLILLGLPVYEEYLPEIVNETLHEFKGCSQPVALVSVYGNIGFGMSLKELTSFAQSMQLTPVAASTFIGEHSFSCREIPLAAGRPDEQDLKKAETFGADLACKLSAMTSVAEVEPLNVPYSLPLMARILPKGSAALFTHAPSTNGQCNQCGACVLMCPTGAINEKDFTTDEARCLRCFSCVKNCLRSGRDIRFKKTFLVKTMFRRKNAVRQEPQIFL